MAGVPCKNCRIRVPIDSIVNNRCPKCKELIVSSEPPQRQPAAPVIKAVSHRPSRGGHEYPIANLVGFLCYALSLITFASFVLSVVMFLMIIDFENLGEIVSHLQILISATMITISFVLHFGAITIYLFMAQVLRLLLDIQENTFRR